MEDGHGEDRREASGGEEEEMSFDAMAKGQQQFFEDAEATYFKFKNEEEMLDVVKSFDTKISHTVEWSEKGGGFLGRDKKEKEVKFTTISDLITNSFAAYQEARGSFYWHDKASTWLLAYRTAKDKGCIVPGRPVQKQLDEKDAMIKTLQTSMKNMFEECPRCHYHNPDFMVGDVVDTGATPSG